MGGVGKTELATQYAQRYEHEYDGILWFNCRNRDVAGEILQFFKSEFEYEIPQELAEKLLSKQEQVAWCWSQYPESNLPILVIFDDVIDANQFREILPQYSRFQILITTRRKRLDTKLIQDIPLDVLSPEKEPDKALELLQLLLDESDKRVSQDPETAKTLCECLGYLPLGIELVGGYLAADPDLSLKIMERKIQAEKLANPALESLNKAQKGVRAVFALTWSKLDPNAQQLGKLLSLFSPKQIHWDLVIFVAAEFLSQEEEKQLTWSIEEINEAKKQLYQRNIIQLANEEAGFYQIHSLVRWFLQEKLTESAEIHSILVNAFILVMQIIADTIPDTPNSKDIKSVRNFIIHLEELAQSLFSETQQESQNQTIYLDFVLDEQVIWIFRGVTRFYDGQGLYQLAEPWHKKFVQICEFFFEGDHPYVASSLSNLAQVYINQGKYKEAKPLSLKALKIRKQQERENNLDVAYSLNNLADLYDKQGKYKEAENLSLQALEIAKSCYQGDHPHVALCLNNLALIYNNQGKYTEAEPLYIQALKINQRLYKEEHTEHIEVAFCLNNLALLYVNQKRFPEAEPLFIRALKITENFYEAAHPHVSLFLNNLATLYEKQRRYREAESLHDKALKMAKRFHQGDHPNVVLCLNNLALIYTHQRKYREAETLYNEALKMSQSLHKGDHPNIALCLSNLADLYSRKGQYTKAKPLFIWALEMYQRTLGFDHPNTITTKNKLKILRFYQFLSIVLAIVILMLSLYLLWLLFKQIGNFLVR